MNDFEGCKLIISARSPFARRVRVALHEHGVNFIEEVIDVFNPPKDFEKINPVQRVPVAILKNRETFIDSNVILWKFYSERNSPLFPQNAKDRNEMFRWTGIALGMSESVVGLVIERMKGEKQSDAVKADFENMAAAGLRAFDDFIGSRETIASALSQGDLDMGTALGYYTLRVSSEWKSRHKNAARYFENLSLRSSFQRTTPPPANP